MPFNAPAATLVPAVIAAGQSLSGAVSTGGLTVHGFLIPAGWSAADLTFQVSFDGGVTFHEMNTSAGTAVDYPNTAGAYVAVDPTLWRPINCLKVRSGTLGSPVNQSGGATVEIVATVIP